MKCSLAVLTTFSTKQTTQFKILIVHHMWSYKKPVHCSCVQSCPCDKTNENFVIDKAFDYNQGEKSKSIFLEAVHILFLSESQTAILSIKEVTLASLPIFPNPSFQTLLQSSHSLSAQLPRSRCLWTVQKLKKVT